MIIQDMHLLDALCPHCCSVMAECKGREAALDWHMNGLETEIVMAYNRGEEYTVETLLILLWNAGDIKRQQQTDEAEPDSANWRAELRTLIDELER